MDHDKSNCRRRLAQREPDNGGNNHGQRQQGALIDGLPAVGILQGSRGQGTDGYRRKNHKVIHSLGFVALLARVGFGQQGRGPDKQEVPAQAKQHQRRQEVQELCTQ